MDRRFKGHPRSAPGDFYVVNGECVSCGAPHAVAPDLIGWDRTEDGDCAHCVRIKQPETPGELKRAITVFSASEVGCHRYAGTDPAIMKQIGREYCDYPEFMKLDVDSDAARTCAAPAVHFTVLNDGPFARIARWFRSMNRHKPS